MRYQLIMILLGAGLVLSCATSAPDERVVERSDAARPTKVTLDQGPRSLSETIRRVGEVYGGNVAAMRGIGLEVVQPLTLNNVAYTHYVAELAEATGVLQHNAGPYIFLYPDARYAPLLNLSLAGKLPDPWEDTRISLALGDGTQLYNAFAILSNSLGISLVADNVVADARCGEIVLTEVSPRVGVEAILQSARIPTESITVRKGPAWAFIASADRPFSDTYRIGPAPEPATPIAQALERDVRLVLPRFIPADAPVPVYDGPTMLGDLLEGLSSQLGFAVEAQGEAVRLPVNPCVLSRVKAREALDLLVGQWPTDRYGYAILDTGVVIRPRVQ